MDNNEFFESENTDTPDINELNKKFDEFILGEDFEIKETEKKRKPKRRWKGAVILAVILALCISAAASATFFGFDYLGLAFGRTGKSVTVEIEKGASTKQIAQELEEAGAIKFPLFFRLFSKFKGYDSRYNYGVYTFNDDIGYSKIASKLVEEGKAADNVTVLIPEGATVDDIAKILEENKVCTRADFLYSVQYDTFNYDFVKKIPENSVYYRLEGYLYPDTYNFYCYDSKECAHLAVEKMLANLDSKLDKNTKKDIEKSKYSFHELLTMASIVELEAGSSPNEMANVAAVFFNRLNDPANFPTLGSSPTIKYPHGDGKYNTYEIKGLPPGPLCSPNIHCIRAALNPTPDFDYYYFVTDKSMKFYYNKTLSQHSATIAKLKAENNWIYEYID